MKRNKHSLSHYKLLSCDMGELVPLTCFEVLPGDSVQQATSLLLRVSPLLAPVMHPVSVRIHHWYVPNRLVWDDWENFITGGSDGLGDGAVFPTITTAAGTADVGSLADYFGVPDAANQVLNALPFRAYSMIFNEFYRDQDLTTKRVIDTTSGADVTTDTTLAKVAWEKDRFTSARPWPQKGPEVTLPLGTSAPVVTDNTSVTIKGHSEQGSRNWSVANADDKTYMQGFAQGADEFVRFADNTGLQVDLTGATAVSVNAVREAFALQRYQEARAMYGSRYTEYLRYLGVRSSDARLQRPEYLGGGKQTISFTEILQTAPTTSGAELGVGNLKGHGIAASRSRRYRRFFEEHGHVISLLSVRPRTMYGNGLERMWSRNTKEDFWQKELEQIGQMEIYNREVYALDSAPGDVFGYNDRYSEYRHIQSTIAGEFRTTLNYWHMARIFAGDVTLNNAFVESDPTKRINAVTTNDVLWIMANHSIQAHLPPSNEYPSSQTRAATLRYDQPAAERKHQHLQDYDET